jgi:hypothetical protein
VLTGPVSVKNLIFFFMFFSLHQGLGLIMKLSVRRAFIFSFLFWLESRLGADYEALSKESLNFFIFFLACIKAWA